MRGGLRLCRPARPGTFLVTLNHCLFTLSQELNELRLRALPGKLQRPHPTLPPTPSKTSLFPTASPNYNPTPACSVLPQTLFLLKHQLAPWESFFFFLIFGRYPGLCGYITPTPRRYQLVSGGPGDWFCQQLEICSRLAEYSKLKVQDKSQNIWKSKSFT